MGRLRSRRGICRGWFSVFLARGMGLERSGIICQVSNLLEGAGVVRSIAIELGPLAPFVYFGFSK